MNRYQFTDEHRFKDLVVCKPIPFREPNIFRGIDAIPPKEIVIKLYDNDLYDLLFQEAIMANGEYEIRVYLQFKRDIRILLAVNRDFKWYLGDNNQYGDFYMFMAQYPKKFGYALKKLKHRTPVEIPFSRKFNIFVNRHLKQYFK
jgi:hypothetical protein